MRISSVYDTIEQYPLLAGLLMLLLLLCAWAGAWLATREKPPVGPCIPGAVYVDHASGNLWVCTEPLDWRLEPKK